VSGISVLRAADRRPQPWKNGGGRTSEVVAYPPKCDIQDFQWRVSMAEVSAPGPFSHFEGIDRTLAVLHGDLELDIGGQGPLRVSHQDDPVAFPGEAVVHGRPISGTVTDLNIMVRRDRWKASIERIDLTNAQHVGNGDQHIIIFCLDDRTELMLDQERITLDRLDAIFLSSQHRMSRNSIQISPGFFIKISPII
jgi:uncharacterized protein